MNDRREPTISGLKVDPEEARPSARAQSAQTTPKNGRTGRHKAQPVSSRPVVVKSKLAPLAFLLVLAVAAMAGYLYTELTRAQEQLLTANSRIAALEEKLVMADDESTASAAVMQASLKEAHSEIRKLWGVAYDRNRKAIADNKSLLAAAAAQTKKAEGRIDALSSEISVLSDLADAQQNALTSIENASKVVLNQARKADENNAKLENQLKALEQRLRESEQDIEAINGFRRSVNQQLQQLRGGAQ